MSFMGFHIKAQCLMNYKKIILNEKQKKDYKSRGLILEDMGAING